MTEQKTKYRLANPNGATAKERRGGWNGSKWISKDKRLAIYIRDGFTCGYCGTDLRNEDAQNVTLDHLKPRSQGGKDIATNLITACRKCNKGRFLTPVKEYATPGAYDRIQRQRRRKLNIKLAKAIIKGTVSKSNLKLETR